MQIRTRVDSSGIVTSGILKKWIEDQEQRNDWFDLNLLFGLVENVFLLKSIFFLILNLVKSENEAKLLLLHKYRITYMNANSYVEVNNTI